MKIREGFVLRDIGGKAFVVATGELSHSFHAMITLNETAKFIWRYLEKGSTEEEIVAAIIAECEEKPDEELVRTDVKNFIEKLVKEEIVE